MFHGIEFDKAIIIFFGYCLLDITSSWFFIELSKLHRNSTTILTFLLYIGGGAGIYEYTHNLAYLVFAACGASLGNYLLLTIEIRNKKRDNSKYHENKR